jgi:hypothetical protein
VVLQGEDPPEVVGMEGGRGVPEWRGSGVETPLL